MVGSGGPNFPTPLHVVNGGGSNCFYIALQVVNGGGSNFSTTRYQWLTAVFRVFQICGRDRILGFRLLFCHRAGFCISNMAEPVAQLAKLQLEIQTLQARLQATTKHLSLVSLIPKWSGNTKSGSLHEFLCRSKVRLE
jgi:hypothetical protein